MASNKTIVLITGSNTGIGYLTAQAIASSSRDYHVIICSRSLGKGQKALSQLTSQNPAPKSSISLLQLDVTDSASISAAAASVEKEFGRLDVLINNAGITNETKPFITQLRQTFETNTFGPAVVTEAFSPLLLKSSDARLIYVSSDLASIALRADKTWKYSMVEATAYRMSKAALNMLMVCNAVAFEGKVKCWAFNPGYVVTDLSGTGEKGRQERRERGAGDPMESAEALLKVVNGGRDADAGGFVHADGVHPW